MLYMSLIHSKSRIFHIVISVNIKSIFTLKVTAGVTKYVRQLSYRLKHRTIGVGCLAEYVQQISLLSAACRPALAFNLPPNRGVPEAPTLGLKRMEVESEPTYT